MSTSPAPLPILARRYVLGEVIGRGGAATVHLGKPVGEGKRGLVAIKRLHPHLAGNPAFLGMMLDEARLLSHVRHRNVVATLDVVMAGGELYIAMEYVHGVTLGLLLARAHGKRTQMPAAIASAILRDALLGLHAAHEATGPLGERLGMVHRDVSPQNLLVGEDGVVKVVDFGIAKAEGRVQQTEDGSIKGKLGYMSPEQLFGEGLDRRADVYAAGVVLWEALVGERLFAGEDDVPSLAKSLVARVEAPSTRVPNIGPELDRIVLRALAHERGVRFESALAMAEALCQAKPPAAPAEVGDWVRGLAGDVLDERGAQLVAFDRASREVIADMPRGRDTMLSLAGATAKSGQRTWALAAAAALCAAVGGGAAVILGTPAAKSATAAPTTELPFAEAPATGATAGAETASNAAEPVPAAEPASGPSPALGAPAAVTKPVPAPVAEPPRTAGSRRPPPVVTAKPAPKADGCDPPFTIDAQGHKRYKRDCLR